MILEPKTSGNEANEVCKRLGKSHCIRFEAMEFSGGIWVLWDDKEIKISLLYLDRYFVNVQVVSAGQIRWEIIVVYVNLNATNRNRIWGKLDQMVVLEPWILISNVNCVTKGEERGLGKGVSGSFGSWVKQKGLIDMGFFG